MFLYFSKQGSGEKTQLTLNTTLIGHYKTKYNAFAKGNAWFSEEAKGCLFH